MDSEFQTVCGKGITTLNIVYRQCHTTQRSLVAILVDILKQLYKCKQSKKYCTLQEGISLFVIPTFFLLFHQTLVYV